MAHRLMRTIGLIAAVAGMATAEARAADIKNLQAPLIYLPLVMKR